MKLQSFITSFFLLPLLLLYFHHRSCVQCNTTDDKKQEKLINILQNLQLSLSEILGTLGPGSASGNTASHHSSSSSSSSFSKASPGPSYVQRPDPGSDYPTSGRNAQKDETTTDHTATSDPSSTTGNPSTGGKGKYAPGPAFRVSDRE